MNSGFKAVIMGGITLVIGFVLWRFAGDVDTPVVTLTKLGIVLMVLGGLEVLYGLFKSVVGKSVT
ncbi:DUF5708 domain-containing protein [Nocardia ninae]|uniref:Uncharacterized protein n=1 Tax=Nocardia ninae NBRC 108245 TaxID=1210091 RepID=A0A511MCP7_9NOCA|nr:DUF5708 family protein [Nocardia ninae]GEM38443.1 hypothetical protein NN4_29620 [Nocardia ninae NBRC 108245]